MTNVGIDRISFHTSHYCLDLGLLAKARGVDPNKFYVGLGQEKMAVCAPDEDIVTLAANAAQRILKNENVNEIDTILFATESSIDQSKSAGVYVKNLLGLPNRVRVVEMKQACYSTTAALQLATAWVARHPKKKVLILSADIARYGFNTSGESSQGCGAVAMLISANPRILVIEPESGLHTEDVMDFWRPNYRHEGLVEGHYSTKVYLKSLEAAWTHYQEESGRNFHDHQHFCYHTPVPRLVEKAHAALTKLHKIELTKDDIQATMASALHYGRTCGNAYSAALYISLISLLDHEKENLAGQRIGFYSYGSGCVAEFFSGVLQPGYKQYLETTEHQAMVARRHALSFEGYESFYAFQLPENGGECYTPKNETGHFRLAGIKDHKRIYEKVTETPSVVVSEKNIKAISPGKLILSGEHAVVYGKPALAMAIDRYVETVITPRDTQDVGFNLKAFDHKSSFTLNTLREMKHRVKDKYKQFLGGSIRIRDVLQTPFELTQYAFVHWLDHMHDKVHHEPNIEVHTHSSIPVGCGLGSSAATVLSVLRAMAQFHDRELNKEEYFKLALEAEQLQHGYTTGLDVHISLHGGCVYFKENHFETRNLPKAPLWLVNTGAPSVTTGECVSYVAEHYAHQPIWNTFESITNIMDQAVQVNDLPEIQSAVRDNHELLVKIGVVPVKVQQFIKRLNALGFAAKVCGSGAIQGDAAGAVLVVGDESPGLSRLCQEYQYECSVVLPDNEGLHVG